MLTYVSWSWGGGMVGGDAVANATDGLDLQSKDAAVASAAEGGGTRDTSAEQSTLEKFSSTDDAAAASAVEEERAGGGRGAPTPAMQHCLC